MLLTINTLLENGIPFESAPRPLNEGNNLITIQLSDCIKNEEVNSHLPIYENVSFYTRIVQFTV